MSLLVNVACMLVACADDAYTPPLPDAPRRFDAASAAETAGSVPADWWSAFKDSRLDRLLQTGMLQNLDVEQAVERINEASANVRAATAGLFPTVTAGAGAGRGNTNGDGTVTKLYPTIATSWMIDLFGGQRATKAAAAAKLDAAYLSADVARLTMLSAITSAYIDLRYEQANIALTNKSIKSRKESLQLTQDRRAAGDAALLDVTQAEQLVAQGEASLPTLEVNLETTIDQLAVLTGEPVATLRPQLSSPQRQPRAMLKLAVGIPAEVLRNRPDVRVTERNLAAAAASVGVAKAALYPSLQLSGYLTPTDVAGVGHVQIWDAAISTALTVFDGGKNRANLSAAQSQFRQARIAWQSAVRNAAGDVEKTLAAYNWDARNIAAQEKVTSTSRKLLQISQDSYRLGATSFVDVLTAEQNYLQAEQSRAQAFHQQALNYVALCVAAAGRVPQSYSMSDAKILTPPKTNLQK